MAYRNVVQATYNTEISTIIATPQPPGSTRAAVKTWLLQNKPQTEEIRSSGAPDIVIGWMEDLFFHPQSNGSPAPPLPEPKATAAGKDIRKQVLHLDSASTNTGGNQTNQQVLTAAVTAALTDALPGSIPTASAVAINEALDYNTSTLEPTPITANYQSMICYVTRAVFAHARYPIDVSSYATQGAEIQAILAAQEQSLV